MRIENRVLTATLVDNKTPGVFVPLLPLTLTMGDLFHREKYEPLPRALSTGERAHSYEIGDIAYWSASPDGRSIIEMMASKFPIPASSGCNAVTNKYQK
jgi:hypothetical protein